MDSAWIVQLTFNFKTDGKALALSTIQKTANRAEMC